MCCYCMMDQGLCQEKKTHGYRTAHFIRVILKKLLCRKRRKKELHGQNHTVPCESFCFSATCGGKPQEDHPIFISAAQEPAPASTAAHTANVAQHQVQPRLQAGVHTLLAAAQLGVSLLLGRVGAPGILQPVQKILVFVIARLQIDRNTGLVLSLNVIAQP